MTAKERLDQHDREIAAIRKLITQGMRMILRIEQAQLKTEASLNRLIDNLGKQTNGKRNR